VLVELWWWVASAELLGVIQSSQSHIFETAAEFHQFPMTSLFPSTTAFAAGVKLLNSIEPCTNLDAVLKRQINRMIQSDGRKIANADEGLTSEEKERLRDRFDLASIEDVDLALDCLADILDSCAYGVAKPTAVQRRKDDGIH
jgi:hypothetical protein